MGAGRLGELTKVERDVDAREEGLVEGLHAVGGEEEDAAVVFYVAQAVASPSVSIHPIDAGEKGRTKPQPSMHYLYTIEQVKHGIL